MAFSFTCVARPDSGIAMTLPLRVVQASATAAAGEGQAGRHVARESRSTQHCWSATIENTLPSFVAVILWNKYSAAFHTQQSRQPMSRNWRPCLVARDDVLCQAGDHRRGCRTGVGPGSDAGSLRPRPVVLVRITSCTPATSNKQNARSEKLHAGAEKLPRSCRRIGAIARRNQTCG
jgi:hypothetical protein